MLNARERYCIKIGWVQSDDYPHWSPTDLIWDHQLKHFVHPSGQKMSITNPYKSHKMHEQVPVTEEAYGKKYYHGMGLYVTYTSEMLNRCVEELNDHYRDYTQMIIEYWN